MFTFLNGTKTCLMLRLFYRKESFYYISKLVLRSSIKIYTFRCSIKILGIPLHFPILIGSSRTSSCLSCLYIGTFSSELFYISLILSHMCLFPLSHVFLLDFCLDVFIHQRTKYCFHFDVTL